MLPATETSYYKVYFLTDTQKEASCGICFEKFSSSKKAIAAHEGIGTKHPDHIFCLQDWLSINPECPTYFQRIS